MIKKKGVTITRDAIEVHSAEDKPYPYPLSKTSGKSSSMIENDPMKKLVINQIKVTAKAKYKKKSFAVVPDSTDASFLLLIL